MRENLRENPRAGSAYRPHIQGLRALAVGIVILDHAGFRTLSGGFVGVDVFFVISGFLITSLLVRDADRHGRISLTNFYARRARRIIPAAAVVAVATVIASVLVLPLVRAVEVMKDALWAAVFAANFRFSSVATDYFAQGQGASPLQHYWSLSVEEQYYLVWPLLLIGCLVLTRRSRRGFPHRLVLLVLALACAASLAWSVYETHQNPTAAYFSTAARAWELGAGSATAVLLSRGSLPATPRWLREVVAVAGLAAVLVSSVAFSAKTPVPGYAVALPVVGTVLMLLAGEAGPSSVRSLLSIRPAEVIGDWSYSLYLWHWPMLRIAEVHFHQRPLPHLTLLLVLLLTLAASAATYRFVETPLREGRTWARPRNSLLLYPLSLALVFVATVGGNAYVNHRLGLDAHNPAITTADFNTRHLSKDRQVALVEASVLAAKQGRPVPSQLTPSILGLTKDTAPLGDCDYRTGTHQLCPEGDTSASRTIVVFGDSHARAWAPGINEVGSRTGYRVYTLVYSGCSVTARVQIDASTGRPWQACEDFKRWAEQTIRTLHPDQVIVSSRQASPVVDDNGAAVGQSSDPQGFLAATRTGIRDELRLLGGLTDHLTVLGDTPLLPREPGVCLSSGSVNLGDCLFQRRSGAHRYQMVFKQEAKAVGADFLGTSQWFCAGNLCPSVVGQSITLRDKEHVTPEYAVELAPELARRLGLDSTTG